MFCLSLDHITPHEGHWSSEPHQLFLQRGNPSLCGGYLFAWGINNQTPREGWRWLGVPYFSQHCIKLQRYCCNCIYLFQIGSNHAETHTSPSFLSCYHVHPPCRSLFLLTYCLVKLKKAPVSSLKIAWWKYWFVTVSSSSEKEILNQI